MNKVVAFKMLILKLPTLKYLRNQLSIVLYIMRSIFVIPNILVFFKLIQLSINFGLNEDFQDYSS